MRHPLLINIFEIRRLGMVRVGCFLGVLLGLSKVWAAPPPPSQKEYVVRERGETLSVISIQLYGHSRFWREIAKKNEIQPPYRIRIGQRISLPRAAALTPEQGQAALLSFWRRKFGLAKIYAVRPVVAKPVVAKIAPAIVEGFKQAVQKQAVAKDWESEVAAPSSAEEYLQQGEKSASAGRIQEALAFFHKGRQGDPDLLPAWLQEIHSLRDLGRGTEAYQVAQELVQKKPAMGHLPAIQAVLSEGH
ncbi:LysM domain-containing protein [Bdellovibrionota bacterium FG-1]